MLSDKFCKELAFPYLFPNSKFGYSIDRHVNLSYAKYFNQGLLNYRKLFASGAHHIFYALSTLQQLKLTSRIKIALKKVRASNLTAEMISRNFSAKLRDFIASDHACQFMGTIKGTSRLLEKISFGSFSMVRQLGLPTFL